MRMYTMHFGQGLEHTSAFIHQAKGNIPYRYSGFESGNNPVLSMVGNNAKIVSHKEIFERYGVTDGHGDYCLETWSATENIPGNAFKLHIGGKGDYSFLGGQSVEAKPFYIKFDFMYTHESSHGDVFVLQRTRPGVSGRDIALTLNPNHTLTVKDMNHATHPFGSPNHIVSEYSSLARMATSMKLKPLVWHEIQIFIDPIANDLRHPVPPFVWETIDYDAMPLVNDQNGLIFLSVRPDGTWQQLANRGSFDQFDLEPWPVNGHPKRPISMLPGQDQSIFPPENFGSGQYAFRKQAGVLLLWVNGKFMFQTHIQSINNQIDMILSTTESSAFLGFTVKGSDPNDLTSSRFFYDNIIWNDLRDPSGSLPSKIFNPLFSSDSSLEWNPNQPLEFTAVQLDPTFWPLNDLGQVQSRRHDIFMPGFPHGGITRSGERFFVPSPNRFGSITDSMIPHGTKLTVVHLDWDGQKQDYVPNPTISPNLYPDYTLDYLYQYLHPEESNPVSVNSSDPYLVSSTSGNKCLFYLKRPPSMSGKQTYAGGPGLGGIRNYLPKSTNVIQPDAIPPIYRIWTCIQDHTVGTTIPLDTQHHLIRIPSGVSGHIDYISDNPCPGSAEYDAYPSGEASLNNGYSMAEWPYNPVSGTPWTWDELDNIQIGAFHKTHSVNNQIYLYTLYLVVEHGTLTSLTEGNLDINLFRQNIADDIPYSFGGKDVYHPGLILHDPLDSSEQTNIWGVSPLPFAKRSNSFSASQFKPDSVFNENITFFNPRFSGVIQYEYKPRFINGDIIPGQEKFNEFYPLVWVFTVSGRFPEFPIKRPRTREVIRDANNNLYHFLTYPVLQYNTEKFSVGPNLSPLKYWPYIRWDLNTLYVIPLDQSTNGTIVGLQQTIPEDIVALEQPSVSGILGTEWTMDVERNVLQFQIDQESFFNLIDIEAIDNHILAFPNESLNIDFPPARSGHKSYFRAPNLPSGSIFQDAHLIEEHFISSEAIDNNLMQATVGLYQTTLNETVNDTGEGSFDFYSDKPNPTTFISGYTFGQDEIVGWHLNQDTIPIPSGTRIIRFTFTAIRNTSGHKAPDAIFNGTSNFASFDEPFCIISSTFRSSTHPADINLDNRISSQELANYTSLWQSGLLPLGEKKDFLTRAECIWQQGVSQHFADPSGGLYIDISGGRPGRWRSSGLI